MKFWKLLLFGKCSECGEKVDWREENKGAYIDRIWFCPNGHKLVQTGESEPFR